MHTLWNTCKQFELNCSGGTAAYSCFNYPKISIFYSTKIACKGVVGKKFLVLEHGCLSIRFDLSQQFLNHFFCFAHSSHQMGVRLVVFT